MTATSNPAVGLTEWQSPPHNRRTFGRMREFVPTARVAAGQPMPSLLSPTDLVPHRRRRHGRRRRRRRRGVLRRRARRDAARRGPLRELFGLGGANGAQQVVPRSWIDDSVTGDPDSLEAFAQSPTQTPPFASGMYRNQFLVPYPDRRVLLCLSIHGQLIYVDIDRAVVVVKLSSCPSPVDPVLDGASVAAEAVCELLA